jgi:hypothetical protein
METMQIVKDLNLDTVEDLTAYLAGYRAFHVGTARVIISIAIDGEVCLSVDGLVEHAELGALLGARIIIRALKEWKLLERQIKQEQPDLLLHCSPVESDGNGDRRAKAFLLAGFHQQGNRMVL